jgi:hypothetical protein
VRKRPTCGLFVFVQDVWCPSGSQQGCRENLISRLQLPEAMFAPEVPISAHADRRDRSPGRARLNFAQGDVRGVATGRV